MKKWHGSAMMMLAAMAAAGCSTDDAEVYESSQGSEIASFVVTGTSSAVDDVVPIHASVSGGAFELAWYATASTEPYAVAAFVSLDDDVDDDADVKFFTQNCGATEGFNCDNEGRFACVFTTDNKIDCEGGNDPVALGDFLVALPMQANMILQVCDGFFDDCVEAAQRVEFQ